MSSPFVILSVLLCLVYCVASFDLNDKKVASKKINDGTRKSQSKQNGTTFQIMTFNIRYGSAMDGLNSWPFRKRYLNQIINSYSPDILCLQEALGFQVEYILRGTSRNYTAIGCGRNRVKGGESVKILVDLDVFRIEFQQTYWLSGNPSQPGSVSFGNQLPRIATEASLIHLKSGKRFILTNTHLDHESAISRVLAVALIQERLDNHTFRERIIVTGDFNNRFNEDEEIRAMESVGYFDTYYELYHEKPFTFHGFQGKPINGETAKIDYIWRKGLVKTISSTIIRSKSCMNRYPSDHFPIICTLELT